MFLKLHCITGSQSLATVEGVEETLGRWLSTRVQSETPVLVLLGISLGYGSVSEVFTLEA